MWKPKICALGLSSGRDSSAPQNPRHSASSPLLFHPLTFLLAYPAPTSNMRSSGRKMELQLPRHLAVLSFVHHFVADRTFFVFFSSENALHANLCALADHNITACPLIQCLPVCLSSPCFPVFSCFTFPPLLSLTLLNTIHLSTTTPGYRNRDRYCNQIDGFS